MGTQYQFLAFCVFFGLSRWLWRTLTLLLEGEFTLLIVVLVLSSSPVLTTLQSHIVSVLLPEAAMERRGWYCAPGARLTFPLFFGMLTGCR